MDSDQTFHTPSFGDEDFGIPLNIPNSAQQNQNMFAYNMGSTNNPNNQITTHHYVIYDQSEIEEIAPVQVQSMAQEQQIQPQQQSVIVNPGYSGIPVIPPSSSPQIIQPQIQPPQSSPKKVTVKAPRKSPVKKKPVQAVDESEEDSAPVKKPSPTKSPKAKGKKGKKDPNEPVRPVSAYAHFFRDIQAAIKGQNPNSTFGEVSKIVAAMWEALDPEHKNVYKKTAETAKRQYLDDLTVYKASLTHGEEEEDVPEVKATKAKSSKKTVKSFSPNKISAHKGQTKNSKKMESKSKTNPPTAASVNNLNSKVKLTISSKSPKPAEIKTTPVPVLSPQSAEMVSMSESENTSTVVNICIRNDCQNLAISSPEWDDEYCSNDCVVKHCKDVFDKFVVDLKASNPA